MRKATVLVTVVAALYLSGCSSSSTPNPAPTATNTAKQAPPTSIKLGPDDLPKSCPTGADFENTAGQITDGLRNDDIGPWFGDPQAPEQVTVKLVSKIVCGDIGAAAQINTSLFAKPAIMVLRWRYAAMKMTGQAVHDKYKYWELVGVSPKFPKGDPACIVEPVILNWMQGHGSCKS